MREFQTGAIRDVGGKGRMDLLPMCALLRISKHMEDAITPDPETGIPHYPERNWEEGIPIHSMLDSALRHLAKYMDGWTDEDHLCAAATNLLMALWTEEKRPEMQDIPSRMVQYNKNASPYARRAASLASNMQGGTTVFPDSQVQEKAPPVSRRKCPSYDSTTGVGRCLGKKEMDVCLCDGSEDDCDFFPERRVVRTL